MQLITVPVELSNIQEIPQIHDALLRGLGPDDVIEATIPQQSPSKLGILCAHLRRLGKQFNVVTEFHRLEDHDLILIYLPTMPELSDSAVSSLPPHILGLLTGEEAEAISDEELREYFEFYHQTAGALSCLQREEANGRIMQCNAIAESLLAVAYRRGLPWAVAEMHKTAHLSQA